MGGIDNILIAIDKHYGDKHLMCMIRCQERNSARQLRLAQRRYPGMHILGQCDDLNVVQRDALRPEDYRRNQFRLTDDNLNSLRGYSALVR